MLASFATLIASSQLARAALPQVQRCDPQTLPDGWVAGQVTAPLKQVAQYLISDPNKKLVCSGTLVVVDGCTFMIKGFTYTDSNESAWFAGLGDDPDGVKLSADAPTASDNQDTKSFTLIRSIGASYTWKTITQVRLFEMTNQQLICTVDLPTTGSSANNASPAQSAISPAILPVSASARATLAPASSASVSGALPVKVSSAQSAESGSSVGKSGSDSKSGAASKSASGTAGSHVWGVAETLVAVAFGLLV
ncbi:hypothetical protein BJ741DRAFT_615265 [Chytriomyces cf. hyalinus JEL632]|nr:hypothetical protein BJ741DRAFT_615265 [Chytriomyces cf. hyalinus JEL632]